jgi:hypothetical protein
MSGTAIQIGNGPNMRRLLEADGLEDVRAVALHLPERSAATKSAVINDKEGARIIRD